MLQRIRHADEIAVDLALYEEAGDERAVGHGVTEGGGGIGDHAEAFAVKGDRYGRGCACLDLLCHFGRGGRAFRHFIRVVET